MRWNTIYSGYFPLIIFFPVFPLRGSTNQTWVCEVKPKSLRFPKFLWSVSELMSFVYAFMSPQLCRVL